MWTPRGRVRGLRRDCPPPRRGGRASNTTHDGPSAGRHAVYDDGRVIFWVAVRATLRERAGNVYLAQTQASCRQGGIVAPDKGAPIMYRCMMELGRDLNGWLQGVNLNAVATAR
jgi:hypothetical protein